MTWCHQIIRPVLPRQRWPLLVQLGRLPMRPIGLPNLPFLAFHSTDSFVGQNPIGRSQSARFALCEFSRSLQSAIAPLGWPFALCDSWRDSRVENSTTVRHAADDHFSPKTIGSNGCFLTHLDLIYAFPHL